MSLSAIATAAAVAAAAVAAVAAGIDVTSTVASTVTVAVATATGTASSIRSAVLRVIAQHVDGFGGDLRIVHFVGPAVLQLCLESCDRIVVGKLHDRLLKVGQAL